MAASETEQASWVASKHKAKVALFEYRYVGGHDDGLVEATLTVILSGYMNLSMTEDMYNVVYEDNTEQISMRHVSESQLLRDYGQEIYDGRPVSKGRKKA